MKYSLGENKLMHVPRVRAALTRSLCVQPHRRRRGVRHRQGPRVQHRPAAAGVCGMLLISDFILLILIFALSVFSKA